MRDFFQQSERIYYDEAPCVDFDLKNDFDLSFFEEFCQLADITFAVGQQQIINNLKLMLPNGAMKTGGALFFGKKPMKKQ